MAGNNAPLFAAIPDCSIDNGTTMPEALTTAAADYTGVSANNKLYHTSGPRGSIVYGVNFQALGTNVATVARLYVNNGSDHAVAANNTLFRQFSLAAVTASAVAATQEYFFVLNLRLGNGDCIYIGLGTTVAAGWTPLCLSGQY